MRYVKLHKREAVFIEQSSDPSMDVLGECLAHDVRYGRGKKRIQWLLLPGDDDTSSNLTFMEKENGILTLGSLWAEDPYKDPLIVPIPVMVDLLEQWDAVCKTNPDEVTVYYQNGKFRVEGAKITK